MKYTIIGDIHGRDCWKRLVDESTVNVFLGDYFSPYKPISFARQKKNFLEIIEFKKAHPETVLLLGNHDEDHWHIQEQYSRFDFEHCYEIYCLFEEHKSLFEIAYSIEDKVLVSHAGVTRQWYDAHFGGEVIPSPDRLAGMINDLWLSADYKAFDFRHNSDSSDYYGTSAQQGPLWVRDVTLMANNIYFGLGYYQAVGHTQSYEIDPEAITDYNLVFADVLGYTEQVAVFDSVSGLWETKTASVQDAMIG